tara:strand:- start:8800 stop:9120 length:321 start_codon:yes stop_codon:yes gene_type:complete
MTPPYFTEPNDVRQHLIDGFKSDFNDLEPGETNLLDFYYHHLFVDFEVDLNDNVVAYCFDPSRALTFHVRKVMLTKDNNDTSFWIDGFISSLDKYYLLCQLDKINK